MRDEEDSRDLQTDGLGMWQRPAGPRETPRVWPPFDLLSWRQFEQAAAEAFRAQGYAVQLTRDGADGGVDLILDCERTLVQCKQRAPRPLRRGPEPQYHHGSRRTDRR